MVTSLKILSTEFNEWRVATRWRGRNLAVHAPVRAGICERAEREWVITHIASGYKAGTFMGSRTAAIRLAKKWDSVFAGVTTENAPSFPHRAEWNRCCRDGVVACP